jgi:hypothetical protein
MPYIKQEQREKYSDILNLLPDIPDKGTLEYCIAYLQKLYMKNKEFRYGVLHDCTYGTIHAGEEFRRKYLDAREEQAERENGSI